jgi:hypothetical protein
MSTYTKANTRIERWQSQVTYAADGSTPTGVPTQVYMVSRLVNDADHADSIHPPWNEVAFDPLADDIKATTITAAGKTVTYQQLAALMRQAALDRANANGIV